MAWHDAKCATLHLDWEDGRPGCRTCQRRAPELTPFHPISPPAPPPDTSRSELVCTWPPKLFSRPRGEDDEDSKLLAIVCANIDEWTSSTTSEKSQTSVRRIQEQPLEDNDSVTSFRRIYSYLPDAGSIRLLRLHGSKTTDDPVHCTLEIHRLHNPCRPVFEAFSYTWADFHNNSSTWRRAFSPQEMCTFLRDVAKARRASCEDYAPLETALSDIQETQMWPFAWANREESLAYPLLDRLMTPEMARRGFQDNFPLSRAHIIHTAWALLRDLTIEPGFTLEQNFNILWIHVLTMEMVARLRGVLQQRLILKAIGDKMKKVQRICLI